MEDDLHTLLFERTTRKVTLTKAGRMLLPEARELIRRLDETIFNVRELNNYHHGIITLSCIPTAVFYFYRSRLANLMLYTPTLKYGYLKKAPIIVWNLYSAKRRILA